MKRGIIHNTHPGELLREEVVTAYNLTILKTAQLLKVSRPTLSNILNGKAAITPNMSIRIAKVFGGNPDLWLRLQSGYDLREAEREFEERLIELQRFKPSC
jgi:addiction module HigA family antidote